jgi:adenylate cyclase
MFALDALELVRTFSQRVNHPFSFRAGISTGQVVSGVIGDARPCFDIWGETVELANSMRDTAVSNSIVVNEPAYWRLKQQFEFAVTDESETAYILLRHKSSSAS